MLLEEVSLGGSEPPKGQFFILFPYTDSSIQVQIIFCVMATPT